MSIKASEISDLIRGRIENPLCDVRRVHTTTSPGRVAAWHALPEVMPCAWARTPAPGRSRCTAPQIRRRSGEDRG